MTFFEARGTVPGLTMALRLTLEDCADDSIFSDPTSQASVRIVEQYKKRWLPPGLLQGATTDDRRARTSTGCAAGRPHLVLMS